MYKNVQYATVGTCSYMAMLWFMAIETFYDMYIWYEQYATADTCSYMAMLWFMAIETFYGMYGCLLYTSPSPRDVEESRMPSSA